MSNISLLGEYDYGTEFKDVDRSKGASSAYAYYNVVCVIAGTGTLGLPHALAQGGWIGIFILVLALLMSTVILFLFRGCLGPKWFHFFLVVYCCHLDTMLICQRRSTIVLL